MKIVLLVISFVICFVQCDSKANIERNNSAQPAINNSSKSEINASPTPKTSPAAARNKEKKMDKKTLAERVRPLDATVSQMIEAENSQLQELDTPFLRDGKIIRVSKFAPTRTIMIYVGIVGEDFTSLIGGDEEKYLEFAQKSGVNLNNDEMRKAYLLNFLEITKPGGERLQILESVSEIKPRPNLKDEQKEEFANFQEKYKSIVKSPKQNEAGKYEVFAVKEQDLVRFDLTIAPNGSIKKDEKILEKDLLIPYAM